MSAKDKIPGISKIVLAFSGGLDTSAILHWLMDRYACEVVCFTADLGQADEIESARKKATALGACNVYVEDLRERFVRDFVFPMFRANAVYEGEYLLGTAIARPLIAERLVEIARETGADAIAHGATAKGNDQLRFELGVAALAPQLKVIAPWREWEFASRQDVLHYCERHGIAVDFARGTESPWSMDANLLHISYEGGVLEDPDIAPPDSMWRWTRPLAEAERSARDIEIGFVHGDATSLDGKAHSPAQILSLLNDLGAEYGIGRVDIVENRSTGMKSRGCYETPGGTILLRAHRAMESITLDREVLHLKDALMPRYADLIYNGYWWSPERLMLQSAIDNSQQWVNGVVRLRLQAGHLLVSGRKSDDSLYDQHAVSFENEGDEQWDAQGASAYTRVHTGRFRRSAARAPGLSSRTEE